MRRQDSEGHSINPFETHKQTPVCATVSKYSAYDFLLSSAIEDQGCSPQKLAIDSEWQWLLSAFAESYAVSKQYVEMTKLRWIFRLRRTLNTSIFAVQCFVCSSKRSRTLILDCCSTVLETQLQLHTALNILSNCLHRYRSSQVMQGENPPFPFTIAGLTCSSIHDFD